jgi:hypothetical protein
MEPLDVPSQRPIQELAPDFGRLRNISEDLSDVVMLLQEQISRLQEQVSRMTTEEEVDTESVGEDPEPKNSNG